VDDSVEQDKSPQVQEESARIVEELLTSHIPATGDGVVYYAHLFRKNQEVLATSELSQNKGGSSNGETPRDNQEAKGNRDDESTANLNTDEIAELNLRRELLKRRLKEWEDSSDEDGKTKTKKPDDEPSRIEGDDVNGHEITKSDSKADPTSERKSRKSLTPEKSGTAKKVRSKSRSKSRSTKSRSRSRDRRRNDESRNRHERDRSSKRRRDSSRDRSRRDSSRDRNRRRRSSSRDRSHRDRDSDRHRHRRRSRSTSRSRRHR